MGQPVVLIHGSGVDWRIFAPQIPVFSSKYRMVMPVIRGHGQSSPLPRTNRYHELMAEDVKRFMDELGIKGAPVIGLSMGAVVALRLASMYPDYVGKLGVVCGYSEMPTLGANTLLWLGIVLYSMLSMRTIAIIVNKCLKVIGAKEITRRTISESMAIDKSTFNTLKFTNLHSFTSELRRIPARTLVMGGDNIKFEARGARTIYEHIRSSTLVIFRGGFDPLNTERQEQHDAMLLNWLTDKPLGTYEGVKIESFPFWLRFLHCSTEVKSAITTENGRISGFTYPDIFIKSRILY